MASSQVGSWLGNNFANLAITVAGGAGFGSYLGPLVVDSGGGQAAYITLAGSNENGILFANSNSIADGGVTYEASRQLELRTGGNVTRVTVGATGVLTALFGFTAVGAVNLGAFARVTGANFTTTGQALVDVTGLTAATTANGVYHFRAVLSVASSSTAGIQVGVQHSGAGASVEAQANGTLTATSDQSVRVSALNTATAAFVTVAADGAIIIEGILTVGANAGNLTIRVLKTTSGTATVYQQSFLDVKRIA